MSGPWLWVAVPLAPLLGAVAVWQWRDRATIWLWLCAIPALIAALWPPTAQQLSGLWPGALWGGDDFATRAWLGFTAALWALAGCYAASYHRVDPSRWRFWLFWLLSFSGNLLLVVAQDGASFYVGFTLMSLAAYGLIVHFGGPGPRQAGRIYLQLAVLGEMLLYGGLLMRVHEANGAMAFAAWQQVPIGTLTLGFLIVGFGLKAGFWPLHIWLPLAHPAAPPAASAVLSGAMLKAGILGLWRFVPTEDPGLNTWAQVLMAVALCSVFYGVVVGLLQHKAKTVLAYSSVSQVGYLLLIAALAWHHPTAWPAAGTLLGLFAVHHSLAKGALFLGAGLATKYRLTASHWVLMAMPVLALSGFPLTSGTVVKTLLKDGFTQNHLEMWLPLLILGSMATTALLLYAMWLMYQDQRSQRAGPAATLWLPWSLLCISPLFLPWVLPAMRSTWLYTLKPGVLWTSIWPIAVVLIAGWFLLRNRQTPFTKRAPKSPARRWSLSLRKHIYTTVAMHKITFAMPKDQWRNWERKWNRFWRIDPIVSSVWLVCLLLLCAWLI